MQKFLCKIGRALQREQTNALILAAWGLYLVALLGGKLQGSAVYTLRQCVTFGFFVLGAGLEYSLGDIDLCFMAQASLSTVWLGLLYQHGMPLPWALVCMVLSQIIMGALRAAQEAGTIVIECGVVTDVYDISMNSSQYDVGTMISDMAGEWINTQLDGKANIVVYTTYQNQDMQNRGQGIQDRIKELCPDSNILEVVDIGKDVVGAGTTYTETMIQKYPDLNCILAYGDAAATEAVEAVKAAGMNSDDFGIFACDGTESAVKYIADNDVMRGTLLFNSIAEKTREVLYQYLDGELEKGAVVDYSITPITAANVADYVK